MKKISVNEVKGKKVICLFNNFRQLLNNITDEESIEELKKHCLKPFIFPPSMGDIYDMGNGYFMVVDNQPLHKGVNKMCVKEGLEQPLNDFEHTTAIYRIVE